MNTQYYQQKIEELQNEISELQANQFWKMTRWSLFAQMVEALEMCVKRDGDQDSLGNAKAVAVMGRHALEDRIASIPARYSSVSSGEMYSGAFMADRQSRPPIDPNGTFSQRS